MIGIYKITNLINNHSYVGQSVDISRRWNAHKEEAKKEKSDKFDYPLYRAIRKYGINNFKSVTDNAVRKWCKKYNLPYKVSDIKKYSDEEWELI